MKHLLTILFLSPIIVLLNQQSLAQCHIDDWTALKALYESTNGDNWTDNTGWEILKENTPINGCDLSLLFGVTLSNKNERVHFLSLTKGGINTHSTEGNNLIGFIPSELGLLSELHILDFSHNNLTGNLPLELTDLSKLGILNLKDNKLTGGIPPMLGNLKNLFTIDLYNNQLANSIPPSLGKLSNLRYLILNNNYLTGSIPSELGKLVNLEWLKLNHNELTDSIPVEIGNLSNLNCIWLSNNKLTGSIPPEISNLSKLQELRLSRNRLSGNIPTEFRNLTNLKRIYIEENYFKCADIQTGFIQIQNNKIIYIYQTQYFTPTNYENIVSNVFDTLNINQSLQIKIDFPFDTIGLTYQWFQNAETIPGATQATLNLNTISPNNAGKYTLRGYDKNCLSDNSTLELISDPIYVIVKGYDLYGQPVEYNQIMVQFNNPEETEKYENEILSANAGWVKDACNCNRELYLWQFPSTEAAITALLEIDRKKKRIKSKNKPKGGFNNKVNIGEKNIPTAYYILSNDFNTTFPDSVIVFMLDSGLEDDKDKFLLNKSPIDNCYNIEKSKGYSYVDSTATVTTNFSDELWHGTFGYHSITEYLEDESALKIVPLKIFDKNGKGNLFDLVCAMYHAIDHNADIINISAGYYGEPSDILEGAINAAREKGIFITTAAGNDTLDIDKQPQYPAYFASQYYVSGENQKDSVKYDNVISVASINNQNKLSQFSNKGKESVTLACYGEKIYSNGIGGSDVVASGTSMSTFFTTKALALEIAKNKQRDYQQIWSDFEDNWLIDNPLLLDVTQTGKHINFTVEEAIIEGCTNPEDINYFPFANQDDGSCINTDVVDTVVGFEIYPNPSNGDMQLSFLNYSNIPKQISVFNCLGKQILSINSSENMIRLNLESYQKGVYFIRVYSGNKTIIQKLVLK